MWQNGQWQHWEWTLNPDIQHVGESDRGSQTERFESAAETRSHF